MTLDFAQSRPTLPRLLLLAIPAGLLAEVMFEVLALGVAPAVLGQAMKPALLVGALARGLLGAPVTPGTAWAIHLLAGVVVFPMGYVLFRRVTGALSWPGSAVLYAVALWLLAQGVLAPAAGRPFMLGFGAYTWASLAVHLAYVLTAAAVLNRLAHRPGPV